MNDCEILFKCSKLKKKKGDFILADINFELPAGYILGVIGRNGAGKTTLTRLLMGSYLFQKKDGCDIILDHVSVWEDVVCYKKKVAFVLNETPFPLAINALDCATVYGHYYDGFHLEKYRSFLKEFEVPEKVTVRKLSKGQQIRQQLAFALSYDAKLYIFDEPTGNLDVSFRDTFYRYVRQLTEDGRHSVIYVSNLVDELEQFADYILWIGAEQMEGSQKKGIQRYFGTSDQLREKFQLIEAAREEVKGIPDGAIVGSRERENHQEMLVQMEREQLPDELKKVSRYASLKEIMYYIEKGDREDETGVHGIMG